METEKGPFHFSPWEGDLLKRHEIAQLLSNLIALRVKPGISTGESGSFVLAITADWGLGKSFLLQRWRSSLTDEYQLPALSYDAWSNDYSSEALLSLISEFDGQLQPFIKGNRRAKQLWEQASEQGKRLAPKLGMLAVEIVAKKTLGLGLEEISEHFREGKAAESKPISSKESEKLIESALTKGAEVLMAAQTDKKKAIKTFRKKLEQFVTSLTASGHSPDPLIVFIDELDRCRPTFAIQLLEDVKHLFGVPGVAFVIGVNLTQLSHSIKAIYGHDFDSERYLKRFFDFEYRLPAPDSRSFSTALLPSDWRESKAMYTGYAMTTIATNTVADCFAAFASAMNVDLRLQKRVAIQLQASVASLSGKTVHLNFLVFLLMLREISASDFEELSECLLHDDSVGWQKIVNKHLKESATAMGTAPPEGRTFAKKSTARLVKLREIIGKYATMLPKTFHHEKWNDAHEINIYDYPKSIVFELAKEGPLSGQPVVNELHSIHEYPRLVRYAGQLGD